jgi:hypothetical protein
MIKNRGLESMKLWIIHKNHFGITELIAEYIQDRVVDYIDVFVGNAKLIDLYLLMKENVDYLIIGDIASDKMPSLEIRNFLLDCQKIFCNKKYTAKIFSGFFISSEQLLEQHIWEDWIKNSIKYEMIYPKFLNLKYDLEILNLSDDAIKKVEKYAKDIYTYIINYKL